MGEPIAPLLRKALEARPSVQAKRLLDEVLDKVRPSVRVGEALRQWRALIVLEQLGTAPARDCLQRLAKGAAGASLTRNAQTALDRLNRRSTPQPK
jgi:hypothetical protein